MFIDLTQLVVKLEFGGTLNRALSSVCVGNGFIRSERWVNIRVSLDGNGFLFSTFSIQRAPHENVTEAERINPFPTNHP